MKTLLFCASFSNSKESWNHRWRRWVDHHSTVGLEYDQILIVDDGSPVLPDWSDYSIITDFSDTLPESKVLIYQYKDNLGSPEVFDYPGLYRSLSTGIAYAVKYGFNKVLNIESDAFVLSQQLVKYINEIDNDWLAMWDHHFQIPELGINVAAGTGLEKCCSFFEQPYENLRGKMLEVELPFTQIEKNFVGARYGEFLNSVPEDADYANQIDQLWRTIREK
jgi:hypothetical protein